MKLRTSQVVLWMLVAISAFVVIADFFTNFGINITAGQAYKGAIVGHGLLALILIERT